MIMAVVVFFVVREPKRGASDEVPGVVQSAPPVEKLSFFHS
jgi:hypothetical protein